MRRKRLSKLPEKRHFRAIPATRPSSGQWAHRVAQLHSRKALNMSSCASGQVPFRLVICAIDSFQERSGNSR